MNLNKYIGDSLKRGKIAVIPTDTIYGIVCSALNKESVEKLYKIRKRDSLKPMIILIGSLEDLSIFNIKKSEIFNKYWPGRVSIIVECNNFEYLHRGKNSLAFRLPDDKDLINILKISGPIVAPSANIEGEAPAETIEEAKKYFGDNVDLYIDKGIIKSNPSKIISLKEEIIRE
ncbi:MAG: L-threonylcarbamoyladenylate synthase [Candidatus Pacebacteria bacterium]|nr:L-threonylcarbamoyladenylate synthase [Candidatus Paceibacterota bacterium]